MYVCSKQSDDESVREFQPSHDLWTRIRRRWRRERIQRTFARYDETRPDGLEPFTDDRTQYSGRIFDQMPTADIISLHWIRGFVELQAFFERMSVPVVWTLHDMNAFTGGCHYNAGCEKYTAACGACPQLGSDDETDLSRNIWERKKEAFSGVDPEQLHIVTPSKWLAEEARSSTLLESFPVTVIPNGLDTDRFAPRPQEAVRTALSLPHDRPVVLFVADSATERRKGFSLLRNALSGLSEPLLVSIGGGRPAVGDSDQHVHLGKLSSNRLLAAAYSAADVFVIPSLQDNLPNTTLESMACGTPVVGFNTGGIPDMVRPGETGWLAETGNIKALRNAIEDALSDSNVRERRGRRCREVVEEEYALDVQAKRYRDLYERLLNQNRKRAANEHIGV
ncbi:glycosyltransferase involved in cell wall biosynthesis [Salinibacter ruber]|nr:glycosyltransferase involved in cell wall biosynthesis [Salinibacter ruber]